MKSSAFFEEIQEQVITALRRANSSVKVCVAWINGNFYSPIFHELAARGVKIEIIYNDDEINGQRPILPALGITLFAVKARRGALMHNKFCVIDDEVVLSGSFNWSRRAPNSFENLVITRGDFLLIKAFLHEFEDLKDYFYEYPKQVKQTCSKCRATAYHLGILGQEQGAYEESLVDIWKICTTRQHVEFVTEVSETFIQTELGLKGDADDYGCDEHYYDKAMMLRDFRVEREEMRRLQEYFGGFSNLKINGVGFVVNMNETEHIKWNAPQEWGIHVYWRMMYYRKVIPASLHDYEGEIMEIIDKHRGALYG